jgi:hypothetical protein
MAGTSPAMTKEGRFQKQNARREAGHFFKALIVRLRER